MPKNPAAVVLALAPLGLVCLGVGPLRALPAAAETLTYPKAVAFADTSAHAVLARAGRETCLRGKLTKALLGLSNSCEASGTTSPLCRLADKAVIVTPMSLAFMDQTSRQLLDLIAGGTGAIAPAGAAPAQPLPESPAEP
ncbi:MAG: hypothetical protein NTV57_03690 [Cyanobacteria bacterium]|nr:hypothetical protein [Cyanobacteriota bacterium]